MLHIFCCIWLKQLSHCLLLHIFYTFSASSPKANTGHTAAGHHCLLCSHWETLQVKSQSGSCRGRSISSVLFLPSVGVLSAPSLPLPLIYLTLTPNVAAFYLFCQLVSQLLSLECFLYPSLFS